MSRAEHRRHPRIRTLVPALAILEGRGIDAVVLNVGPGGAFLLEDVRLEEAESFSMALELGDHGVIPVVAKVVRKQLVPPRGLEVPGIGVEFVDLTPGARAALDSFSRGVSSRVAA